MSAFYIAILFIFTGLFLDFYVMILNLKINRKIRNYKLIPSVSLFLYLIGVVIYKYYYNKEVWFVFYLLIFSHLMFRIVIPDFDLYLMNKKVRKNNFKRTLKWKNVLIYIYKIIISRIEVIILSFLIGIDKNNSKLHYKKAKALIFLDNANKALENIELAIFYDESQEELAKYFKLKGEIYENLGKFYKAIEEYSKAIKIKPISKVLFYKRGMLYKSIGMLTEALVDFTNILDECHIIDSKDIFGFNEEIYFDVYESLGEIYYIFENYKKAVVFFAVAIEIAVDFPINAIEKRGDCYTKLGKNEEALLEYKKIFPDYYHEVEIKIRRESKLFGEMKRALPNH